MIRTKWTWQWVATNDSQGVALCWAARKQFFLHFIWAACGIHCVHRSVHKYFWRTEREKRISNEKGCREYTRALPKNTHKCITQRVHIGITRVCVCVVRTNYVCVCMCLRVCSVAALLWMRHQPEMLFGNYIFVCWTKGEYIQMQKSILTHARHLSGRIHAYIHARTVCIYRYDTDHRINSMEKTRPFVRTRSLSVYFKTVGNLHKTFYKCSVCCIAETNGWMAGLTEASYVHTQRSAAASIAIFHTCTVLADLYASHFDAWIFSSLWMANWCGMAWHDCLDSVFWP